MMTAMTINAYAKVNFTLEVFGERADGYHALRSLVVPISLHDTVTIERDTVITSDSPYPDDLCIKAAKLFAARLPDRELGAKIHVDKRIPAGGGLGGGSADAAATLIALNELWNAHLPREELIDVARAVGSDVPSLVCRQAVLMEGRGEIVTPINDFPALNLVVAHPNVFSSTKEVYGRYRFCVTNRGEIVYNILPLLREGKFAEAKRYFVNDLEKPAIELHGEIKKAIEDLEACGGVCATMTGSGSCVFALVPESEDCEEIAKRMNAKGYDAWSVRTNVR